MRKNEVIKAGKIAKSKPRLTQIQSFNNPRLSVDMGWSKRPCVTHVATG